MILSWRMEAAKLTSSLYMSYIRGEVRSKIIKIKSSLF